MNHIIDEFCLHDDGDCILDNYSLHLIGDPNNAYCKGKYYTIQIVYCVGSDNYTFFCRYGGASQVKQTTLIFDDGLTKDEAIVKFKKKFKNKIGKDYDSSDIYTNQSYNGYVIN